MTLLSCVSCVNDGSRCITDIYHDAVILCIQALMLPEAVRLLHLLVSSGKRVYVHCTAGINRATLTTVGYLTFVKVRCSCLSSILHHSSSKLLL